MSLVKTHDINISITRHINLICNRITFNILSVYIVYHIFTTHECLYFDIDQLIITIQYSYHVVYEIVHHVTYINQ